VFASAEVEEITVPEIVPAVGIPLKKAHAGPRLVRAEFARADAKLVVSEGNGGRPCRT
jgi:hypothetical protein